jgi:hypothetical protein
LLLQVSEESEGDEEEEADAEEGQEEGLVGGLKVRGRGRLGIIHTYIHTFSSACGCTRLPAKSIDADQIHIARLH